MYTNYITIFSETIDPSEKKKMLENTEGASKNGQSRETSNVGFKTKKNTTQYVLDTTRCKQTQITQTRHDSSYKQLDGKTNHHLPGAHDSDREKKTST